MGCLRVIAGERKGFRLSSPRGNRIRPTSGRVKEALFDILGGGVKGACFLDLFAGTGAVGIESLSRGAAFCVFLEENGLAVKTIRRNLETCGFEDRGRVILGELPAALSRIAGGVKCGIVFADPPYEARETEPTLEALGRSGILAARARVVVEHRRTWEPPPAVGRLRRRRSVRYGDTVLSFFEAPGDGPAARVDRD